jgi:poly(3-hydroxybutyrate) depolymerase
MIHHSLPQFITRALAVLATFSLIGCSGGGGGSSESPPSEPSPATASCNPVTGLGNPLPLCTPQSPCTKPAPELGVSQLTTSFSIPSCRTTESGRPVFNDGPPLGWTDPDGVTRSACLYSPSGASAASQRPLVVWLHGGGSGSADDVYNFTSLRAKAPSYDLTGDPQRPGFFLLSVHGRHLHYPTEAARDGNHHDFYFRDLAQPSRNPDIAHVDRLIDNLVSSGHVDPRRIYFMGWSNGAFFSQMYVIARQRTPTPGGNIPAAAVAYTGADPFHNTSASQTPSCQLNPYPATRAPIFLVSRSCDIVACDVAQAQDLARQGTVVSPGHIVGEWQQTLTNTVGNTNVLRRIVSGTGQTVAACTAAPACTSGIATVNHLRWPDGVADSSGVDHEQAMLDFLRNRPL